MVYVTGQALTGAFSHYGTVKYDPLGRQSWAALYGNYYAAASALALDTQGNVYVTGWSRQFGHIDYDYATVKYGPDGRQLWDARYNGPGNGNDAAAAIAVDGDGNV